MTEQEFLNTKWSKTNTVVMTIPDQSAIHNLFSGAYSSDSFANLFVNTPRKDRYFHVYGVNWRTKQLKIHFPDYFISQKLDDKGFLWVDYQKLRKYE